MANQIFPTKGNLINTKKSLQLAKLGYELLDRKRNILIRELMQLIDKSKELRGIIEDTYIKAYSELQTANITMGVIENIAKSMPLENSLTLSYRSVMGCQIPKLGIEKSKLSLNYGFEHTNSNVDKAIISFYNVKHLTVTLAEVENSVYRLAIVIKKTQTRANALKNIVIPRYERIVTFITNSLEEKEREDFSRMKVIKAQKIQQS